MIIKTKSFDGPLILDRNMAVTRSFEPVIEMFVDPWFWFGGVFLDSLGDVPSDELPFLFYELSTSGLGILPTTQNKAYIFEATDQFYPKNTYWDAITVFRYTRFQLDYISFGDEAIAKYVIFAQTNSPDSIIPTTDGLGKKELYDYAFFVIPYHIVFQEELELAPDIPMDYAFGAEARFFYFTPTWKVLAFSDDDNKPYYDVNFTWTMTYFPLAGGPPTVYTGVEFWPGSQVCPDFNMPAFDSTMKGHITIEITSDRDDWKSVFPVYHWAIGVVD